MEPFLNILLTGLMLGGVVAAHAQGYSIDWFKVSGGGGTSTGGVYSASGTIGQPDAGANMSGGSFSVSGGFWSLISIAQTYGSPTMTVTHSGNNISIVWPSASSGFVLQQNSNLATTNWTTSGFTISDDGTNKSIIITSPSGNLFFRLKQ